MRPKIYIAGPYSGDTTGNTARAIIMGTDLLDRGFAPYIPHLTHFWHLLTPKDYEVWMQLDLEYVAVCDGLYRLPGKSPGADREIAHAVALGIPVFYSLDTILNYQWPSTTR